MLQNNKDMPKTINKWSYHHIDLGKSAVTIIINRKKQLNGTY